MEPNTIYYAIAAVLALIGLVGIVLPAIPGLPLVFCGMLLAAWADGFTHIGVATLVVLAILTVLSLLVDFWAAAMGAKRVGASRLAIAGAIVGTVAGLFLGPVGLFAGPFLGALLGELLHGRSIAPSGIGQATRVGIGTWLGLVFGIALKLMLAFAMIGLFAWSWFR